MVKGVKFNKNKYNLRKPIKIKTTKIIKSSLIVRIWLTEKF